MRFIVILLKVSKLYLSHCKPLPFALAHPLCWLLFPLAFAPCHSPSPFPWFPISVPRRRFPLPFPVAVSRRHFPSPFPVAVPRFWECYYPLPVSVSANFFTFKDQNIWTRAWEGKYQDISMEHGTESWGQDSEAFFWFCQKYFFGR